MKRDPPERNPDTYPVLRRRCIAERDANGGHTRY